MVRAAEDYYTTLGVDRNADKKTIKSAYRQKARKFHPDVNKEADAEEKFKSISNAYEVLSDDQKRGIYDRQAPVACAPEPPNRALDCRSREGLENMRPGGSRLRRRSQGV